MESPSHTRIRVKWHASIQAVRVFTAQQCIGAPQSTLAAAGLEGPIIWQNGHSTIGQIAARTEPNKRESRSRPRRAADYAGRRGGAHPAQCPELSASARIATPADRADAH